MISAMLFPESVSAAKRKQAVIRELVKGREHATQLRFLLQNPNGGSLSAKEMVASVVRSFSVSLSVITSEDSLSEGAGSGDGGDGAADQNHSEDGSSLVMAAAAAAAASSNIGPEDSSGSCGKRIFVQATKDRRGSYKRRKSEQTRIIVSPTTDDDHSWRKYGQKEILNTPFPRSYFRCTRKHDQGCRANKQVQRIQENPDMYQITYIGFHTCKDTMVKAPEMVTFSNTWDSFLVNSHPDSNEHHHPIIKQECPCSDETPSDVIDNNLDHSLWSDLKDFELSKPSNIIPSSSAIHMDFGVLSSNFSTDFHFEESNLLYSAS